MDPTRRAGEPARHPRPPSRPSACPRRGSTRAARKRRRCAATRWSTPRPCSSTHLTELLKANMSELLSYARGAEAARRIAEGAGRPGQGPRAGADLDRRASSACCRCCWRSASRSAISPTILEGIADGARLSSRNPATIAEHVRARLARQICAQSHHAGRLPAADRALGRRGSRLFAESIVGQGDDRTLAMQPSRLSEFITSGSATRFEEAARQGEAPVLVTSPSIRPFVRGIVERFRAQTQVLSQSENAAACTSR